MLEFLLSFLSSWAGVALAWGLVFVSGALTGAYVAMLQGVTAEQFYERQYRITRGKLIAMCDEVDARGGSADAVLQRWYQDEVSGEDAERVSSPAGACQ